MSDYEPESWESESLEEDSELNCLNREEEESKEIKEEESFEGVMEKLVRYDTETQKVEISDKKKKEDEIVEEKPLQVDLKIEQKPIDDTSPKLVHRIKSSTVKPSDENKMRKPTKSTVKETDMETKKSDKANDVKKKPVGKFSEKTKRIFKVIMLLSYTSLITYFLTKYVIMRSEFSSARQLKYWLTLYNETTESLDDIRYVFNIMGHEETTYGIDYDVIWTLHYPFVQLKNDMENLQPSQKVNHIPGIFVLLIKPFYCKMAASKFIPKSFNLPDDNVLLKEYVKKNPQKFFIETDVDTGAVKMRKSHELRLMKEKSFVQEFIEKPLLLDGRFFDVGFYVVITSVDPLRVYVFDEEVQVRLCVERYHPFDTKNPRKFNINYKYAPMWEVSGIDEIFNATGGGIKTTLESNLKSRGFDVESMWKKVDEAIASIVSTMESHIIYAMNEAKLYEKKLSFFEVMRFDFAFDSRLNPYLMNIASAPTLYPGPMLRSHQPQFSQLLYNVMNLIGIGHHPRNFHDGSAPIAPFIIHEKDIAIDPVLCAKCDAIADKPECALCSKSENDDRIHRIFANWEFYHRGHMRRIFPSESHFTNDFLSTSSARNQMMILWYREQCKMNKVWC